MKDDYVLSQGKIMDIVEIHITLLGTKHPWAKETQGFTNKNHSVLKKETVGFFLPLSML